MSACQKDAAIMSSRLNEHETGLKVKLVLEDGTECTGLSFGAERSVAGEVVFNTGMVGYPESLTDPSYKGQILVLTYPLIGNYGVPSDELDEFGLRKNFESDKIQVTALIIADYSDNHSHWTSQKSLGDWLKANNIPAIYGLDTRALTKKLREKGAMLGKVQFNGQPEVAFEDPNLRNLVGEVSHPEVKEYGPAVSSTVPKIIAVDCGMKYNIIRFLVREKNVHLKVVPWDYDFNNEEYDGLFISNGPGDPKMCAKTIENLRTALQKEDYKPIFGICLGNQLLALAAGASTYKMKYGNRGMNQPCIDLRTTLCYITPQNHGFAVDPDTLPNDWTPFFMNANDYSNEGLIHKTKPFFSVQFHPEACGGPTDTAFLFDTFLRRVLYPAQSAITTVSMNPRMYNVPVRRVLLLGSGGLSIGQAGEFDYSGSQCIKALKEENIFIILVNPNIATVQTGAGMADKVYFVPVTPDFVTDIIRKERPDGILCTFGGQTALNCGIKLYESGVLKEHNVRVLGTPIETIVSTEDREVFAQKLAEIGERVAPAGSAKSMEEAVEVAARLGYPVLVRAAYVLGGLGSGFATDEPTLRELAKIAFASSAEIMIDKSLKGWKEVEYEVVRDAKNNCVTVCNMENFDPLGIHTGDSIVVAPSQTLSNSDYYRLRSAAITIIRHLGVVGECNIQYALSPHSDEYCVVEVNARLSRSSALASKATGYPLAYVAAKLALGHDLVQVRNSVTKTTTACFEPSLDYCVVKIPRWDLRKFHNVSTHVGTAMKSVGEVMAIGRKFEEAIQKAIRMVDDSYLGFSDVGAEVFGYNDDGETVDETKLDDALVNATDKRLFAIAKAMKHGYSVDRIHSLTKIDKWFLSKLVNIIDIEKHMRSSFTLDKFTADTIRQAKRFGFSDKQIAHAVNSTELDVRALRKSLGVTPFVKQIDTLAAEFPAFTNYLYCTYNGDEDDLEGNSKGVVVLGCGAYRIGSSVEFDWCAVSCIRTLRQSGHCAIMINYNPETVSTDYDECDRLYFEELSFERVTDIYERETATGVIVSVGGQIPNNIAIPLHKAGLNILGTSPECIDRAENRFKFSQLCDSLHIDQPAWVELTSFQDALDFCDRAGFPVLVRPSYVLSGAAMKVANDAQDLSTYLKEAAVVSKDFPVVVSKFILNAKEIEMDAVAKDGEILNYAISEHVENAGVHSGDATLVLPAQKLYVETIRRVKKISSRIAHALKISGPFNIQFLSRDNEVMVIECNLRASRTFPFISKTFNTNFIELATRVMTGLPVKAARFHLIDLEFVGVKAPQFSFTRLQGADPVLGVEMVSTGEVACFGEDKHEAFLKAILSAGFKLPEKNILLSTGPLQSKVDFLPHAQALVEMGYNLFATSGTASFLKKNGVPVTMVHKPSVQESPNIRDLLSTRQIDLVINVPESLETHELTEGYHIRRTAVDYSVSLLTDIKSAILLTESLMRIKRRAALGKKWFEVKSWDEYVSSSYNF
eukprot:GILK01006463.1.p1 GENE.GILK01006463.1~~GILK01006463.1.p1  ORF type:complete len:1511 (+),score=315.38 GILK01006463.1:81-4535(+)